MADIKFSLGKGRLSSMKFWDQLELGSGYLGPMVGALLSMLVNNKRCQEIYCQYYQRRIVSPHERAQQICNLLPQKCI
jgi:hypothetical protein